MLLVCNRNYLKLVLSYTFLILYTYHPDTCIYVNKDLRIRGYFSKPEGTPRAREFGKNCPELFTGKLNFMQDVMCYFGVHILTG
jgi:hypothetical protein